MRLRDQLGMVQVGTNGEVIVGVSDDSTVMIWTMQGRLRKQFYHHRSSVYGLVVISLYFKSCVYTHYIVPPLRLGGRSAKSSSQ